MDANKDSDHKGNSKRSSQNSKAFDHCLSVLYEEVQLAIQWNRPGILLAVHTSKRGMEKAQKALENKLSTLFRSVIHVHLNGEQQNLFDIIKQTMDPDCPIYFVDGIGKDKDTYRALNLYRERLVEEKLIVVFWLTDSEAKELPRLAPDFWVFRHRVLEFAPSRGSVTKALPSGLLIWQAENPFLFYEPVAERIAFQEDLLAMLPASDDALFLRAEAIHALAGCYWVLGETQKAEEHLQRGIADLTNFHVPDILAKFKNGLAILAYDRMNYAEALNALTDATRLHPQNSILWVNLGLVYYALGKSGKALQTIQKAIRTSLPSPGMRYVMGHIYLSMGKLDSALSSFQESLSLTADSTFSKYGISICHKQMNNVEEQKRYARHLDSPQTGSGIYHSICMAALQGDESKARTDLHTALTRGDLSAVFLKRDPILNAIFDETTMQSLA